MKTSDRVRSLTSILPSISLKKDCYKITASVSVRKFRINFLLPVCKSMHSIMTVTSAIQQTTVCVCVMHLYTLIHARAGNDQAQIYVLDLSRWWSRVTCIWSFVLRAVHGWILYSCVLQTKVVYSGGLVVEQLTQSSRIAHSLNVLNCLFDLPCTITQRNIFRPIPFGIYWHEWAKT